MTPAQLIAYGANVLLVLCAWRFLKVRLYALTLLATDLVRLALLTSPSKALPLYAIDGLLLMSSTVVLAVALKANPWPVTGLGLAAVMLALVKVHEGQTEATTGIYVAALMAAHVFTTVAPISSRKWRRNFDPENFVLIGLSATGLVGAFVVIAWDNWDLVNTGNVVAHLLLGVFAFFASRRD